ncbi:MAG: hypothetical protein ACOH1Y_11790 [Propionicimonas sp.]
MSTLITFDPNKTADWLDDHCWKTRHQEGVRTEELRDLVQHTCADGLFGDVEIELATLLAGHTGPRQAVVTVTVKNPANITRVISPGFDPASLTAGADNDLAAALTALTLIAEKAALALAPLTTYVVAWVGGHEAPAYSQHATLEGATAQAAEWITTYQAGSGDDLQVLEVTAGSPTVTLIAHGGVDNNNDATLTFVAQSQMTA